MSKQRKNLNRVLGVDPSLEHASALVQEYSGKLRTVSRRIRDVREEYLAATQRRREQPLPSPKIPVKHSAQEEHIWFEVVDGFRSRHEEFTRYLRALIPHAKRLAQHVSQLITHGTDQTIVKIELSLRVAELESAVETAQKLAASNAPILHF